MCIRLISSELREAPETMATESGTSLHAEILRILNNTAEGFERVGTRDQVINALKIQNAITGAINKKQLVLLDYLSQENNKTAK